MQTKQELYSRQYQLSQELLTIKKDMAALIEEFSYHKNDNPEGYDKKEVKKITKAASAKATEDNLAEKVSELEELQEIQELYS